MEILADKKMFEYVEKILLENGTKERFEKENGKITGRMMITLTEIPKDISITGLNEQEYCAFECSFDFYDAMLGVALDTKTLSCVTGIWVTPQIQNAVFPTNEWAEFFVKTLVKHIDEQGNFGVPIYIFLNDNSDFAVVPSV